MKNLFKLSFILAFLAFFSSCENDDTPQPTEKLTVNEYITIGKMHNDGLDYIHSELLKIKNKDGKLDETNFSSQLIVDKTKEYIHKSNGLKKHMSPEFENKFYEGLSDRLLSYNGLSVDKKKEKLYKKLSPIRKEYFEKVHTLIFKENISVADFQSQIKNIMQNIIDDKRLETKKKKGLLTSVAVAYHSYEYWANNKKKWNDLFITTSGLSNKNNIVAFSSDVYWPEVVFSDAGGAMDGVEIGESIDPFGGGLPGAIVGGVASSGFDAWTQ